MTTALTNSGTVLLISGGSFLSFIFSESFLITCFIGLILSILGTLISDDILSKREKILKTITGYILGMILYIVGFVYIGKEAFFIILTCLIFNNNPKTIKKFLNSFTKKILRWFK